MKNLFTSRKFIVAVVSLGTMESVSIQLSGNRASKRNLWFEQNDTVSGVLAAKALLWLWMRRER